MYYFKAFSMIHQLLETVYLYIDVHELVVYSDDYSASYCLGKSSELLLIATKSVLSCKIHV